MVRNRPRLALRRRTGYIPSRRRGRVGKTTVRRNPGGRPGTAGVVRGGNSSSMSVTAIRRLVFLPKKIAPPGSNDDKWWIELLKMAGRILMTMIITALSAANNKGIPTGCLMRIGLAAEDLVYETTCVDTVGDESHAKYREAKVNHITVTVIPSGHLTSRAGTLYLSLVSCTGQQFLDDYSVKSVETTTLVELQQQPGMRMASAVNPLTISWRPRSSEESGLWQKFGSQSKTPTSVYGIGATPLAYLTIGYADLSSNTQDVTTQYSMTEATFDVVVKARVLLRQGESRVFVRKDPISMIDATSSVLVDGKSKSRISNVVRHPSGYLSWSQDPLSDFEMVDQ